MNDTPNSKPAGNELLAETKQKIAESVPDKFDEPFLSIVTDGAKLMWSNQTHQQVAEYVQGIQGPQEVPAKVAQGIKKTIAIIAREGNIPAKLDHPFYPAAMAAAQFLACDALEYIEQKKQIPVDSNLLAATTKAVNQAMMQLFGITEQLAKKAYAQAQQQQGQPAQPPQPTQPPPAAGGVPSGS